LPNSLVASVYVLQMAVFYIICHDGCVCDNKSPYCFHNILCVYEIRNLKYF